MRTVQVVYESQAQRDAALAGAREWEANNLPGDEEWACVHIPCTGGDFFELESGLLPSFVAAAEADGSHVKMCDDCLEAYRRAHSADGKPLTWEQAVARYQRTGNAYGDSSAFIWPRRIGSLVPVDAESARVLAGLSPDSRRALQCVAEVVRKGCEKP
jgi:hypothetical protein